MNRDMYNTTKELLLQTPLPTETRTYKVVDNAKLIDLTLEGINKAGFTLDKELYTWAKNGMECNGRYTISSVADKDMQLMIGWQNSYNKNLTLKFAIGGVVFICTNGCVYGDMGNFRKKHVGKIREFSSENITEYIKQAGDVFDNMVRVKEKSKEIELSKRTIAELVGRMHIEEEIINVTQLSIIKGELDKPSFDYGCPGSVWELYQHTSHSLKNGHPSEWMKKHTDTHNFFVNEFGLIEEKEKEIFAFSD